MRMDFIRENCACLLTDRITRRYFSGCDVAEGFLLLFHGKRVFFTDARYFYAAKNAVLNAECKLYTGEDCIKEELDLNAVRTLYIDYDTTTLTEYAKYKKFGAEIKDCGAALKNLRLVKSDGEIGNIARACKIIESAFYAVLPLIKKGVTEKQIKAAIESEVLKSGGEGTSFDVIVAFGENSAVPHHVTGDTALTENMPVLIDCGCKYNGYCSDLTRTAFYGKPSAKFLDVYDAVKRANEKAERELTPDMPLKQADAVAREYLKSRGYGEKFTHSLGHGVGLEIHESPYLSPKGKGVLPVGAAFTVEPGVYIDGEFGVRIEDTAVMTANGVKRLFGDGKELIIL